LPPAAILTTFYWLASVGKLSQMSFVSAFTGGIRFTIRFEFLTGGVIVFLRSNRGQRPLFRSLGISQNLPKACNIRDHAVRECASEGHQGGPSLRRSRKLKQSARILRVAANCMSPASLQVGSSLQSGAPTVATSLYASFIRIKMSRLSCPSTVP